MIDFGHSQLYEQDKNCNDQHFDFFSLCSYALAAQRHAALHSSKPMSPDQTLIRWINFTITNGPLTELRPHALDLDFLAVSNIDVYTVLVSAILAFGYVGSRIVAAIVTTIRTLVESQRSRARLAAKLKLG